ncbi:MAG: hypothetical protein ACRD0Z_03370 [Acidimicrobiales bacterium]
MAEEPPRVDSGVPWGRRDWRAVAFMAGFPALLLAIAALAGYPLITGDDLAQNFPLEELSGRVLAAGHMPLWDPYLWSGTPLLGGTNAHSFLPITLLFAVFPPLAAWVVGEAVVFALAAVGTQLLLRRTGCSTLAAGLGGAVFGFGGFFSSQIVHVDFASAAVSLPWALVALDGLANRPATCRARHALLLALAAAWLSLAGSPDIVVDAVVACGLYSAHLMLQPQVEGQRQVSRAGWLAWAAVGGLTGVAVGALQWLPAADFVNVSQRAHPSFSFISGGSLTPANFLELLVPHVLGGGSFGTRPFGGTFPLAEVDAYPGTLALVAVFAMLAGIRRPEARRWRVWLLVAGAGLLIASGDHTPLEHLLAALPITGSERLPSRALILEALAAAMLLGYFVDDLVQHKLTRTQVLAGLVPLAGVVAVVAATLLTGRPAGGALTAHGRGWSVTGVLPYLAVSVVLAAVAAGLLLLSRRRPVRVAGGGRLALAVAVLVIADIAIFDANQSSLVPTRSAALSPGSARRVAALAGNGRYLVVDPSLAGGLALDSLGAPDLGVVDRLADAGGYGSLLWGPYSSATGTHAQDGVSAAAFADGAFASLGVRAVLVSPPALGSGRRGVAAGLAEGGWRREGSLDGFDVFVNHDVAPPFRLTSPGCTLTVLSSSPDTGAVRLRVTSPGGRTELVRSEADVPGWRVTVTHGLRTETSAPRRHGLVQAVDLPAGASTVAFTYTAPGWAPAQLVALGGAIAGLAIVTYGLAADRRRRSALAVSAPR